jgi:hypothetical protein
MKMEMQKKFKIGIKKMIYCENKKLIGISFFENQSPINGNSVFFTDDTRGGQ